MRLLQLTRDAWYQPYSIDLIIECNYYRLVYFPKNTFNILFVHPINPYIAKVNI